jgi:hypothetical protein
MGMATQCQSLRDTAKVVAKMGFKMFLGIQAEVGGGFAGSKEFLDLFAGESVVYICGAAGG